MNLHIPFDQILSSLYCAIAMFLKVQWNPHPHKPIFIQKMVWKCIKYAQIIFFHKKSYILVFLYAQHFQEPKNAKT